MATLTIDNFAGKMTQFMDGNINSGLSNVFETYGNNVYLKAGNLTWYPQTQQVDPNGTVITDLIMAGKTRKEGNILYVYAIGHTGRLYKIQTNDPSSYNPDYDNAVLLTTLTSNSPTFTRGGFIDFYGATERIYIGHDKGVTRVDFTGANETFVGTLGSWTQNVPRPIKQFLGKMYIGNGSNIAEIDSTATVTSYTKLSPGFPTNTQVRDIDLSPDGRYVECVVTTLALQDITSATQNTTSTSNAESYIFKWNGIDTGYTSSSTFPSFSLSANILFGNRQFTFGYDQQGAAIFDPLNKILSEPELASPLPNAIISNGNVVSWMAPISFGGHMYGLQNNWGVLDHEVGLRYWSSILQEATGTETDVIQIPCQIQVSNFGLGPTSNGFTDGVYSTSKLYFSALETSDGPTVAYRLYKWSPQTTTEVTETVAPIQGVYQTQSQLFSKKVLIGQVRIYADPWVAGNSFTVDLIGSSGNPITNGSYTFTAGTNLTIGDDFAWFDVGMTPTYVVALRITNNGTVNHTINKVEIDYSEGGK